MLANFQPPPPPRFPLDPNFSTVKVHPSEGRLRLYLWHLTSPAIYTQSKSHYLMISTDKNHTRSTWKRQEAEYGSEESCLSMRPFKEISAYNSFS